MSDFFGIVKRRSIIQFFRYSLLGITINFFGYLVYLWITYLGVSPKVTMSFSYGIGVMVGFWGIRKYIFAHEGELLEAGFRYLLVHSVGYLINLALLIVMVDIYEFPHQWVQAFAVLIVALFLFVSFKMFVFEKTIHPNKGA